MSSKDQELVDRLIARLRKNYPTLVSGEDCFEPSVRDIKIKTTPVVEKEVCTCSNDEPYCDGSVEDCKCECECHGLYLNDNDFDLDTEECRKVQDFARFERKFKRVRHSDMFTSMMNIDFERVDLPAADEITEAHIYYDYEEGKQVLSLTVKPLGHDTYLDKFLTEAYLGKVYLLNKNVDVKKTHEQVVLSENCLIRSVDCADLIGDHGTLEYTVEVEL